MKRRSGPFLVLLGILITILLAAAPHRHVQAKDCFDAQNKPIPCPQYKNPTQPSAPTPTSTPTPTATPTATATPIATAPPPVPPASVPPPTSGGFACPPYAGSIPFGLGGILAGGLIFALARSGEANRLLRRFQRNPILGVRRTGAALGAIGSIGFAGGVLGPIGIATTGLGAGLLGAALLGGLLGINCTAAPLLLPSGTALGLLGGLGTLLISRLPRFGPGSHGPDMGTGTYSTFERMGTVEPDGSVTSGSGLYKNQPLE